MQIQSASAYSPYSYQNISSRRKQAPANVTADFSAYLVNNTGAAAISQTSRDLSDSAAATGNCATAVFDTNQGPRNLNIDDYFSPGGSANGATSSSLTLPPLLLPSQNNVKALADHISASFPQFLAQNNIPSAPSSIGYDDKGQIQLPSDYAYAPELEQALANNPTMARELQTVHALSSHLAGLQKLYPFQQEYAAAATLSDAEAVVAKYSYLFGENRQYSAIALNFSESGGLSITADGNPLL